MLSAHNVLRPADSDPVEDFDAGQRHRSARRSPHRAAQASSSGPTSLAPPPETNIIIQKLVDQNEKLMQQVSDLMQLHLSRAPATPSVLAAPPIVPVFKSTSSLPILPQEIMKSLQIIASEYQKHTMRKLRVDAHIVKMTKDLAVLALPKGYPDKARCFKSAESFAQLDSPASQCATAPFVYSVTLLQGTTRREAAEQMYRANMRFTMEMELDAHREHLLALRASTTKAYFVQQCLACKLPEIPNCGLEVPAVAPLDPEHLTLHANDLHAHIVDRVCKARQQEQITSDKAAKAKEKELVDLASAKPENILSDIIAKEVAKAHAAYVPGMDVDADGAMLQPAPSVHSFVRAISGDVKGKGKSNTSSSKPKNGETKGKGKSNTSSSKSKNGESPSGGSGPKQSGTAQAFPAQSGAGKGGKGKSKIGGSVSERSLTGGKKGSKGKDPQHPSDTRKGQSFGGKGKGKKW
jgi:hypothetical protein